MRLVGKGLGLSLFLVVCAIALGPASGSGWPAQAVAWAEASGPRAVPPAPGGEGAPKTEPSPDAARAPRPSLAVQPAEMVRGQNGAPQHSGALSAILETSAPGAGFAGPHVGLARVAASPVITFNVTTVSVYGYTAAGSMVHLVLTRQAASVGEAWMRADDLGYFNATLMQDGRYARAMPGDALVVSANGATVATLTAPGVQGTVEPASNSVTGMVSGVPLPAALQLSCMGHVLNVSADNTGHFAADFAGVADIAWYTGVLVTYQDKSGNWLVSGLYPQNGLVLVTDYGEALGYTAPGTPVTVTLTHNGTSRVAYTRSDNWSGGWWVLFGQLSAGDVVNAQMGGQTIIGTAAPITGDYSVATSRISGNAPANSSVTIYASYRSGFAILYPVWSVPVDALGHYALTVMTGLDAKGSAAILHHGAGRVDTYYEVHAPGFSASWTWNNVWGYAPPGAQLTVTLQRGASTLETVNLAADPNWAGYFDVRMQTGFQAGDQL